LFTEEGFQGRPLSIITEDPPTHHYSVRPVPAEAGNGQGLAFIGLSGQDITHITE